MLFEGFPEGAMFRSILDQEFLYPSRGTVMPGASRLAASQYVLDGRFVPWGIATPEGFYGGGPYSFGCPRGVLLFPLARTFKNMMVRCVLLTTARATARFERELSIESCLVALSTARGDGGGMVFLGGNPSLGPSRFTIGGRSSIRCRVAR